MSANAQVLETLVVKFTADASEYSKVITDVLTQAQQLAQRLDAMMMPLQTAMSGLQQQQAAISAASAQAVVNIQSATQQSQQTLQAATDASANSAAQVVQQAQSVAAEVADALKVVQQTAAETAQKEAKAVTEVIAVADSECEKLAKNLNDINAETLILGHSLISVGQQLSSIGTAIQQWLVMPLIAAGKTAIMAASEAEESANKFTEVFGYVAREAEKMAKVLDNSFGMSRVEARRLMGATGDLLNSFGFTKKASLDLSVQVQQLAADMVSFSNFEGGVERASTAITRALLGEKEMLKLLGKAILDKDVLERVAINTAKGLAFETERQAKAFATLQLIQEQSLNAVGDYQRTMWQFANQLRELQSNIQDVAAAFGQDLLPAATSVVTALNSALAWVKDLNPVMRGFVEAAGIVAVAVGGLIASLLALGGVVVYTAWLSLVLKASLVQLSGVIVSAASAVATAVASMSAALTASMAAALATPVGLAAAIVAVGTAASVASYKFSLWMTVTRTRWRTQLFSPKKLQDLQAKRSDDVLSVATGIGDAETRKKYLEEQIAQAEKDVAGRTLSVQMSQQQADESDTTFQWATGNKLRILDQQQLTEDLQLLEAAK